jgi:hypothetical protein
VQLGAGVFVDASLLGAAAFSPDVRVSALWVESRPIAPSSGGDATLTIAAARIEGCPLRLAASGSVSLLPCVGFEAGALQGSGKDIANQRAATRFWGGVDAFARLTWDASNLFVAEMQGGLTVPLVRHEFIFIPNVSIYDLPPVGAFIGIGLGVHFP